MNAPRNDDEQPKHAEEQAPEDTQRPGQDGESDDSAAVDDDEFEETTETTYERLPGGGHRVTRRTTRRRVTTTTEDIDEHIVEDLPADAYRAPAAAGHPAPVG